MGQLQNPGTALAAVALPSDCVNRAMARGDRLVGAPEVVGLGWERGSLRGMLLCAMGWSEELPGEVQGNAIPDSPQHQETADGPVRQRL